LVVESISRVFTDVSAGPVKFVDTIGDDVVVARSRDDKLDEVLAGWIFIPEAM